LTWISSLFWRLKSSTTFFKPPASSGVKARVVVVAPLLAATAACGTQEGSPGQLKNRRRLIIPLA
jgi:hypothetical protein